MGRVRAPARHGSSITTDNMNPCNPEVTLNPLLGQAYAAELRVFDIEGNPHGELADYVWTSEIRRRGQLFITLEPGDGLNVSELAEGRIMLSLTVDEVRQLNTGGPILWGLRGTNPNNGRTWHLVFSAPLEVLIPATQTPVDPEPPPDVIEVVAERVIVKVVDLGPKGDPGPPGEFAGDWDEDVVYSTDVIVVHGSGLWRSMSDENVDNEPSDDSEAWHLIATTDALVLALIGDGAIATINPDTGSMMIGPYGSVSNGDFATAINGTVEDDFGVALGAGSLARMNGIALGSWAQAMGSQGNIAIGILAETALGDTTAIGRQAEAKQAFAIALGRSAKALTPRSIGIGFQAGMNEPIPADTVEIAGIHLRVRPSSQSPGTQSTFGLRSANGDEHVISIDNDGTLHVNGVPYYHPGNLPAPYVPRQHVPLPFEIIAAGADPGQYYTLEDFSPDAPPGTYPPNMVFLRGGGQDPVAGAVQETLYTDAYNLSSGTRINGHAEGFILLNLGTQGDLGSAILALNTQQYDAGTPLAIAWRGTTHAAGGRVYQVRLQYRVGSSGVWANAPGSNVYTSGAAGHTHQVVNNLPLGANGQELVQLRWQYSFVSGNGTRPAIRIGNIYVGEP